MSDALIADDSVTTPSRQTRRASDRAAAKRKRQHKPERFDTPMPLLLTTARAAHELSVSERKIKDMLKDQELELVPAGPRSPRITRESVLRVAARRGPPDQVKNFARQATAQPQPSNSEEILAT